MTESSLCLSLVGFGCTCSSLSRQDKEGGMDRVSVPSCVTIQQTGKHVCLLKLLVYVNRNGGWGKGPLLSWDVHSMCVSGRRMF